MNTGLQSMLQQVMDRGDAHQVEQAASDHMDSMDGAEVKQHLETAARNANQSGETGIAQQVEGLLSQHRMDPEALKDAAVSMIKSNPQLLAHFAPSFAQGVLGRLGV